MYLLKSMSVSYPPIKSVAQRRKAGDLAVGISLSSNVRIRRVGQVYIHYLWKGGPVSGGPIWCQSRMDSGSRIPKVGIVLTVHTVKVSVKRAIVGADLDGGCPLSQASRIGVKLQDCNTVTCVDEVSSGTT